MLLWVAGNAEVELRTRMLDGCAISKETFIESYYLPNEVCGMGMATGAA